MDIPTILMLHWRNQQIAREQARRQAQRRQLTLSAKLTSEQCEMIRKAVADGKKVKIIIEE